MITAEYSDATLNNEPSFPRHLDNQEDWPRGGKIAPQDLCAKPRKGPRRSRIPSFSNDPVESGKRGDFEQHSAEAFDQRSQTRLWHHWDKIVEHSSLTKQ